MCGLFAKGRGGQREEHFFDPRRAAKNTSFYPRRATKDHEEHLFLSTKGHEEHLFWSSPQIVVVEHENQLRNGPILPAGFLLLSRFE